MANEAVLDPTVEPFFRVNEEPAYTYYVKKPEINGLMLNAMPGVSVPFIKALLNGYDAFQGVERLVEVVGNARDCLRMIMHKHPSVCQGINFDMVNIADIDRRGMQADNGKLLQALPIGGN
ncbi:hypothetical protein GH714_029020 [Hevea brasiliensis]|uniref:O-methyltransferase C-terminal domain-containing protein n=1 Tax=Hevea brasiliensis TaxID=3981 RepID=A0A6A6M4N2_HEVBR|nr:hypothetical protein GH714_029020 [Hevea brasiliensis]